MKRVVFAILTMATFAASKSEARPEPQRPADAHPSEVLAIVGGEVHTVSGAVLPEATVLVRGEVIVGVGAGLQIPKDTRVIDAKGKIVTPGLVESASQIGLVEVPAEPPVDGAPWSPDPIRAAVSARDAIDLGSTLVPVARRHGVTSVVSVPAGGVVSGASAWVDLVDGQSARAGHAVSGPAAMNVNLGAAGAAAFGGSRILAIARFKEALDDARTYQRERAAFQHNALYKLVTSRLDLAALGPVVDGRLRVVLSVNRASDIRSALALAREEKLDVALLGADEGWMVADELQAAHVPVIVDPLTNLPDAIEGRNARIDNVALLAKAGVKVAVATRSSHQASNLRFVLGNAVRAGLEHEAALRSATLTVAEIFHLEKQYGSIEPGKVANLVVWAPEPPVRRVDPFEPSSFAETVVIRGEVQSTETRQTKLARRYLDRRTP